MSPKKGPFQKEHSLPTSIFQGILLMEKNHAPVNMVNIPLLTGVHTCQVMQDFFHQYVNFRGSIIFGVLVLGCPRKLVKG